MEPLISDLVSRFEAAGLHVKDPDGVNVQVFAQR
jgi:hypothetical protein